MRQKTKLAETRKLTAKQKEMAIETIETICRVLELSEPLNDVLTIDENAAFKTVFDNPVDREYMKAKVMNLIRKI